METPQEGDQRPAEGADQPQRRASRSYATHEESLQSLWLDIFLNPDSVSYLFSLRLFASRDTFFLEAKILCTD